ncbi:phosphoribosylformylglycinamidine synthase II, partial [Escherichia coli]|nr:phosphoribosylformylglycinamidine synthase II [Escherichia coli]
LQYVVHGTTEGRPPELDLNKEKALLGTVLEAIQTGLVRSAHDLSEGGLAVALAESCISGKLGAQVNVETSLRGDHALFSESQSRILLSAAPEQAGKLEAFVRERGVPVAVIGRVEGSSLTIEVNGTTAVNEPVGGLTQVW